MKVKVAQSCLTLYDTMDYLWNSPGQNTGVGGLSLLKGIFLTEGSNPGLPHCKWILYQLSLKGSPRILEWVACPDPGTEPGSAALQADSSPTEPSGKPDPEDPGPARDILLPSCLYCSSLIRTSPSGPPPGCPSL